jgi:hypothetical protein
MFLSRNWVDSPYLPPLSGPENPARDFWLVTAMQFDVDLLKLVGVVTFMACHGDGAGGGGGLKIVNDFERLGRHWHADVVCLACCLQVSVRPEGVDAPLGAVFKQKSSKSGALGDMFGLSK